MGNVIVGRVRIKMGCKKWTSAALQRQLFLFLLPVVFVLFAISGCSG
jgi:hypothetical protein